MENVFDMSKTAELSGVFYEKLGKNKFRGFRNLDVNTAFEVRDKKVLAKLNKIFGKKFEEDEVSE